ncbi:hypothetical protein CYMTET_16546 [Cymbomonas tetramitiformis]|uniref:Uncharacterized protein n=1 Tax=Cymbomonas tetramitiformis TaxID=36881 RepID=A0AAE0L816_9CHLO|nr:hypothetical protein CYMTET_16546 [Cymbomonas tetramitiformis]
MSAKHAVEWDYQPVGLPSRPMKFQNGWHKNGWNQRYNKRDAKLYGRAPAVGWAADDTTQTRQLSGTQIYVAPDRNHHHTHVWTEPRVHNHRTTLKKTICQHDENLEVLYNYEGQYRELETELRLQTNTLNALHAKSLFHRDANYNEQRSSGKDSSVHLRHSVNSSSMAQLEHFVNSVKNYTSLGSIYEVQDSAAQTRSS